MKIVQISQQTVAPPAQQTVQPPPEQAPAAVSPTAQPAADEFASFGKLDSNQRQVLVRLKNTIVSKMSDPKAATFFWQMLQNPRQLSVFLNVMEAIGSDFIWFRNAIKNYFMTEEEQV